MQAQVNAKEPYFEATMAEKLLILGGLLFPMQVLSQDSLAARVAELHMLLDSAAHLSWEQAWPDEGPSINTCISYSLQRMLSIPMADSTLDRVTRHEYLQRTRSADGRLWAFHWFENTGGSFHSYAHVFHLRTSASQGVTVGDNEEFLDGRAPYSEIHRLRTKNGERLYLALGEVRTCGSCCAQVAVVFRTTSDSLDLAYPAFAVEDEPATPGYALNARCGSLLQWNYNAQAQLIDYVFRLDDLSPVPVSDEQPDGIVRGSLRFDGERFIEYRGPVEAGNYPKP